MSDEEFAKLVQRATELRGELKGRLPERVYLRYKDWLLGTVGFSTLERGAYLALLLRQLDKGGLPNDTAQLAVIAELPLEQFEPMWGAKLSQKFREHAGELYNAAMLHEFIAAAEPLISRRRAGQVGGQRSGVARAQQAQSPPTPDDSELFPHP